MAQADPRIKNIKIHTGVVKRISKEKKVYEKEALDLAGKVEKMEKEGADHYVVKKQREVLQESQMMVPDSQRRLEKAIKELEALVKTEENKDLAETEEYKAAETAIEEANQCLLVDA